MTDYPRDLVGYGRTRRTPLAGRARVAVNFVLNYEEGGENCVLHGDERSEAFLSEIVGADMRPARHMSMESIYEYGSRVGVWRILDLFRRTGLPLTVFAVGMAAERNPGGDPQAMVADGHEICSHGYRWIDYQYVDIDTERAHLHQAIEALTGGRQPAARLVHRPHVAEHPRARGRGGRLPVRRRRLQRRPAVLDRRGRAPHLVVPYTLDANDMRFASPQGFNSGDQFFAYLRDTFDVLYAEGERTPRMMSIGLHCRLVGRPGRFAALRASSTTCMSHDRVWVAARSTCPPLARTTRPGYSAAARPSDQLVTAVHARGLAPDCTLYAIWGSLRPGGSHASTRAHCSHSARAPPSCSPPAAATRSRRRPRPRRTAAQLDAGRGQHRRRGQWLEGDRHLLPQRHQAGRRA